MKNRPVQPAGCLTLIVVVLVTPLRPARAQSGPLDALYGAGTEWIERSERIRAEQPHWITPLVTVTPRMEQEIRYDEQWQAMPHGRATNVSGGARLELIPFANTEIILGAPPYVARSRYSPPPATHGLDNWGDTSFLVKYRLLAAPEERGNYIVTLFIGATAPTGPSRLGARHGVFTPTLAAGKGWGDFDIQSTLGASLPAGGMSRLGMPLAWNTALQYRVLRKFWPEVEFNYTYWPNGERIAQHQLFVTPGLVIGRLPLWKTLGLTVGAGLQAAVSEHRSYDHNWVLSVRLPF